MHSRIEARIDQMLDAGWLNEVEKLRSDGVGRDLPSMSAIGYRQLFDYIENRETWDNVREAIELGNRRLISAQNNWFKARDDRISWFDITVRDFGQTVFQVADRWLGDRSKT